MKVKQQAMKIASAELWQNLTAVRSEVSPEAAGSTPKTRSATGGLRKLGTSACEPLNQPSTY
jgi:hypothetical protein